MYLEVFKYCKHGHNGDNIEKNWAALFPSSDSSIEPPNSVDWIISGDSLKWMNVQIKYVMIVCICTMEYSSALKMKNMAFMIAGVSHNV